MRFIISEIQEYLLTDPEVRILIVEGRSDIAIWQNIVPINQRRNCVIYSVEEIDLAIGEGGNKGAALALAKETVNWEGGSRVLYFLDADNDNLIGRTWSENIVLTDARDMESYALIDHVFDRLCQDGANETQQECHRTKTAVRQTIRRVGILRFISEKSSLGLPFQLTLAGGTLNRFLRKKGMTVDLKVQGLLDALCHNAGISYVDKQRAISLLELEETNCQTLAEHQVVHGKDLIAFLAWYFSVSLDIATGMIRLSTVAELEGLRLQPNLKHAEDWVRAA